VTTTSLEALVERANYVAHSVTCGALVIRHDEGQRPFDATNVLEVFESFLKLVDPDFRKHYVWSYVPSYGWQFVKEIAR
jgi:hypothetical protein